MDKKLFESLLQYIVAEKCSDLHILANYKPHARKSGDIIQLNDFPVITDEILNKDFIPAILAGQVEKEEELKKNKQLDISYSIGNQRYRVNIFTQKGHYGIVIRVINFKIPALYDLGLPDVVNKFTEFNSGLVLVTGPTGSGKSTTLASIIDVINSTQKKHILTVEDPIEYVHNNKLSIVNQREVGQDVGNFNDAVKAALREDPDIVLVGEMRDLDTISNAITIAETGHLVFGTLHTMSAPQTIDRIVDVFDSGHQQQIRVQLASALQAVVCQKLITGIDGKYKCAAEVMIVNDAIRGIIREGRNISQISDIIGMGKKSLGTQTLDQALADLYSKNKISQETAIQYCNNPDTLKRMIMMYK